MTKELASSATISVLAFCFFSAGAAVAFLARVFVASSEAAFLVVLAGAFAAALSLRVAMFVSSRVVATGLVGSDAKYKIRRVLVKQ